MAYIKLSSSDNYVLRDFNDLLIKARSYDSTLFDTDELADILQSKQCVPTFRLYALNYDETIKEDLSDFLLDGGTLNIKNENGRRYTLSLKVNNETGFWKPSPVHGYLWKGQKFRFDIGLRSSNYEFWKQRGVFVLNDFSIPGGDDKTLSLELLDKFASIDGTIGGKLISPFTFGRGYIIYDVIKNLLESDRINGLPYDPKPFEFPPNYMTRTIPYTINKDGGGGESIGSFIIELAESLSLEVYYNEYGNLVFIDSDDVINVNDKTPIWRYRKGDYIYKEPDLRVELSKVENVVIVEGANINGMLMDATVQNTNPASPTNIYLLEPNVYRIQDENIASVSLAQKRGEYELFKRSLLPLSLSFKSSFLPHLDVDNIVTIFDDSYPFNEARFLINEISIPISFNSDMTITATNTKEVALI